MQEDEIHIFPFFSENRQEVDDELNLEANTLVLRGQILEKRPIDPSLHVYCADQKLQNRLFYWHPMARKDDVIQKGIELVKTGLKPNAKTGIIENLFIINKRAVPKLHNNFKKLRNKQ